MDEAKYCARCLDEIPRKRIEILPKTVTCVKCSEEIGGDYELEVQINSTGKVGSLKKTGEEVNVSLKPRVFK